MIEDLLAFAVIIMVWKIVQVWVLKRRIARFSREVAAAKGELDRLATKFEACRVSLQQFVGYYGPTPPRDEPKQPMHMGKTTMGPIDPEWPEEIS